MGDFILGTFLNNLSSDFMVGDNRIEPDSILLHYLTLEPVVLFPPPKGRTKLSAASSLIAPPIPAPEGAHL